MQITTELFVNSTDFVNSTTNYTAHYEDNSEPFWLIGIGVFVFFCLMGSCGRGGGRNTGSNHRPRAPPQNTQPPPSTQTPTVSEFTQITPPTDESTPTTPPSDESTSTTPPADEYTSTSLADESTSTTSSADGSSSTTADESASSTPPVVEFTSSPAPAAIYIQEMEGGDTYQDDSISPTAPPPSYDSIMNHNSMPPPSYDETVVE